MPKVSTDALCAVVAAAALGALFYFGAQTPPLTPPTISTVAPVSEPPVLKSPVVPPLVEKPTEFRRVLKGGKRDGKINCKAVPQVAHQFSQEQVLAAAKEYGLSPAQISALRVCLN